MITNEKNQREAIRQLLSVNRQLGKANDELSQLNAELIEVNRLLLDRLYDRPTFKVIKTNN